MNPKISVIIPVFNTERYLKEAIDSILKQREYIYEIIIVNDGSTDQSKHLLEKYYQNFDSITILNIENSGPGTARNCGTKISRGDFIYYFDSDDISSPDLFRSFRDLFSNHPYLELFCFSGESFLDIGYSSNVENSANLLSKWRYSRKIDKLCESGEEAFNLLSSNYSFFPNPSLFLFKKSILDKNRIKFLPIIHEDEEFTPKLFICAGKTIICNSVYYKRRLRKDSITQKTQNFANIEGCLKAVQSLIQFEKRIRNATTKFHLRKKIFSITRKVISITKTNFFVFTEKEIQNFQILITRLDFKNPFLLLIYSILSLALKIRSPFK